MPASRPATVRSRVETARALAARLPDLLVAARRIAANVMLGVHGRRHPGPGETFWQFRPYVAGEPARQIDWRRSARDDHLFVREREWEASQTVWLWVDLSPSMDFRSRLSETTKLDRAVILMLALADMLGRGGERVGMPGLAEPRIGRDAAERLAEVLAHAGSSPTSGRGSIAFGRFSDVVVLSDFLAEAEVDARAPARARRARRGHASAAGSRSGRGGVSLRGAAGVPRSGDRRHLADGARRRDQERISGAACGAPHDDRQLRAARRVLVRRASHRPARPRRACSSCSRAFPA